MTKKQQPPATVDDEREPLYEISPDAQYVAFDTPAVRSLISSGIITMSGRTVTWRDGHLEHVAAQYKSDPQRTRELYSNDVEVAEMFSADEWKRLTE